MVKRPIFIALGVFFTIFILLALLLMLLSPDRGGNAGLGLHEKLGVIEIEGAIAESRKTIEDILDFAEDKSIRAILVRIDSPGGAVGPSQEIHDELRRIDASVKPVYVSLGSVAASGGYYIAVAGRKIYANPGTLTGSIGVIMEFPDLVALLDKIGLTKRVIKSGAFKDIGSPVRAMTAAERRLLQELIDDVHQQFVAAVCAGRDLPQEQIAALADGRIFTGRQALDLHLIDTLGGFQQLVRDVAADLGIKGKPKLIYPKEEHPPLLDYLLEQRLTTPLRHLLQQQGLMFLWRPLSSDS